MLLLCTVYSVLKELYLGNHLEQDASTITLFLLRMTDTMATQNIDLSSWNTMYKRHYMSQIPHSLVYQAHLLPDMSTKNGAQNLQGDFQFCRGHSIFKY
jgi:hypothetical protein